jgi:tRNA G18 (ribose-2'-O)-methylase SpoU
MTTSKSKDFFVIAHNIRSLFNVGSLFRSADAFGVSHIYLTGYTGTPPDAKIAKVALGAEQYLPWQHAKSPVRVIKKLRAVYPYIQIVGLENNLSAGHKPIALPKFKPQFPLALVLGEETKGIPRSLLTQCDQLVEIPMQGQKESLNVIVAFAVAAYHIQCL